MSDDAAPSPGKRGRKFAAEKVEIAEKAEPKKRTKKEVAKDEVDEESDGASPPKRGRGRPKGTTKKKAPSKAKPAKKTKATGGRGRGRPKKNKEEEAPTSEEDDVEANDAESDE